MKLAFLLGLSSVPMVMGKTAKLAEMAKTPELAEENKDQRAAAERMDKEDAMEKRQGFPPQGGCDPGRQLFMIDERVTCVEAEKLCKSKNARLARFNINDQQGWNTRGYREMERLKKYLEIRYDYSTITQSNYWAWDVWVSGRRLKTEGVTMGKKGTGAIGNSLTIELRTNRFERPTERDGPLRIYSGKSPCNHNYFPVCEIV